MNFVSSFNNNDIRSLLVQMRDDATFVRKTIRLIRMKKGISVNQVLSSHQ